ncbi:E3 ubiquitin-protein ligase WAV3-like [Panicum virgatum]|nr:E3 ubiquitin-protein ligase WAV3-like [Panicum virgatum]
MMKPVKYFKDDAALTADTVTAEVEINVTSSTTVREGLDLVAVLDVSGSMKGDRIESLKKAMTFVIMKLTPVDRLSIVTFSDGATRLSPLRSMTPAAQSDLRALVTGLQANGGTNIQAGLETGLAVIADRVNTKARTANVFLFSGGQQTSGDARQVDPGQVAIYTFGLGRDTDHQLMGDIAKKSPGGTFSSVPDGSRVSLPFSQLLAGLLTVVAQDVELTITPKMEYGDVDTIVVAPCAEYMLATDATTGVVTIKFGTLFAGEGRRVVMTLAFKDVSATFSEEYDAPIADAELSFAAQGRPRDRQIPQDIQIKRTPTPSQAPGASSSKARQVHVEVIRQARVLAGDGQLEDARRKLVEAQEALEINIVLDHEGEKLVNSLRDQLQQLIKLMDTEETFEARRRPYALASETSHGRRQRYAARGSDEDGVRLFATPRMDTYREQAKNFEEEGRAYALASETSHGRQRYAARGGDDDAVRLFATPRMDAYLEQAKKFEKDPTAAAPSPASDED